MRGNKCFSKKLILLLRPIIFFLIIFLIGFPFVSQTAPISGSVSWSDTFSDATGVTLSQTKVSSGVVKLDNDPANPGKTYSSGTAVSNLIQPSGLLNWDKLKATVSLNNPSAITFNETLSTTTYKDAGNTTADWNTASGKVLLVSSLNFATAVNYSAGADPYSIFSTDLDGDGDSDLAVPNSTSSNNVSILLNNGNGTFASAVNYSAGAYPSSIFSTDLDGDGDQDLAVANNSSNNVSILLNNGNGTFASAVSYSVGANPISVFSADFDGDGDNDLAVVNSGWNGNVSILLNNGDGTFASAVNYAAGYGPRSVFSADFNGDGDQDLAVANSSGSNVSILPNNGDGTFATAVNYSVGSLPFSVFSTDFNGDGDNDLAVANYGSSNISILLNNGNGTFASVVNYSVGTNPYSVFSADLDGDGDNDLAAANYSSNNVSILPNNGNGTFASAVNYSVGTYPISIFSIDLDGDSEQDLAVVNGSDNNVSILMNVPNYSSPLQAQSTNINSTSGTVPSATLTATETKPSGTGISYYLSVNGGTNWEGPVSSGVAHTFTNTGTDLRWKAVLTTSDSQVTPEIDALSIQYTPVVTTMTLNLLDSSDIAIPGYSYVLVEGANEFDISALNKDTYSKVKMKASLTTLDTSSVNPELEDWEITWALIPRARSVLSSIELFINQIETSVILAADGSSTTKLNIYSYDQYGNSYSSNINLSLTGLGQLSNSSVSTPGGIGEVTYITGKEEGKATIIASSGSISSNEVTINLKKPSLEVNITAEIIKPGNILTMFLGTVSSLTSNFPWWLYLISIFVLLGLFYQRKSLRQKSKSTNKYGKT